MKTLNKTKPQSYNVIPFVNEFSQISTLDLDNILESLRDLDYLNENGIEFKKAFWTLFIKKSKFN